MIPTLAFLWLLDAIGLEGSVETIIVAIYLLFFLMRLVFIWYRYHHDYWVVTNQRVIDIKRNHPLNMLVSTADLVNIQDMTIRRNGLLKTMLDYGDVVCQTAGTDARLHDRRRQGPARRAGPGRPRARPGAHAHPRRLSAIGHSPADWRENTLKLRNVCVRVAVSMYDRKDSRPT